MEPVGVGGKLSSEPTFKNFGVRPPSGPSTHPKLTYLLSYITMLSLYDDLPNTVPTKGINDDHITLEEYASTINIEPTGNDESSKANDESKMAKNIATSSQPSSTTLLGALYRP